MFDEKKKDGDNYVNFNPLFKYVAHAYDVRL